MNSPLSSSDPDALTALFASDPLTLTDAQLDAAVAELRRRRNVFASEEAAKALAPKKTRTKATAPTSVEDAALRAKPTSEVNLSDLD